MTTPPVEGTWKPRCALCAARGRRTDLKAGHCCDACQARLRADLSGLLQMVVDASAELVEPMGRRGSGTGSSGMESKPPADLDLIAPHMVRLRLLDDEDAPWFTATYVLSDWERLIREQQGLTRYGEATADHLGRDQSHVPSGIQRATRAFTQAVQFLEVRVDWMCTDPEFPLEEFARQVNMIRSAIRGLSSRGRGDKVVKCPTITENGPCGASIRVRLWIALEDGEQGKDDSTGELTTCPKCRSSRTWSTLLFLAGGEDTFADIEAITAHFGISRSVVFKWARDPARVRRRNGLYCWGDIKKQVDLMRGVEGAGRVGA